MPRLLLAVLVFAAAPALADVEASVVAPGVDRGWTLQESDRIFLLADQADTMAPMSFRVGTLDQFQTVQSAGSGFLTDVYADFAPLSWLQVGLTINYGNIGDPALQDVLAPTLYAKAQFLRQATAGVNVAAEVNFKKVGFGSVTNAHPNAGEFEGMLLVDRRIGHLALTLDGVLGKSVNVPDSDAELKLGAGYYLLANLLLGVDFLGRYDTSFDGGPQDGTRYWELTTGPMATWKISDLTLSGLVGLTAPMHTPGPSLTGPGVGPVGIVQLAYGF